jgi:hypothetical protein
VAIYNYFQILRSPLNALTTRGIMIPQKHLILIFFFTVGSFSPGQTAAQAPNTVRPTESASKPAIPALPTIKGISLTRVGGPPMERFPDLAIGGNEAGQVIFNGQSSSGMESEGKGVDVLMRRSARKGNSSIPTVAVPLGSFAIQDVLGQPTGIKAYQVQIPAHARAMGRLKVDHPAWFSIYLVNERGLVEPNMGLTPKFSDKPAGLATNNTDVSNIVYFVLDSRTIAAAGEPYTFEIVLGRIASTK